MSLRKRKRSEERRLVNLAGVWVPLKETVDLLSGREMIQFIKCLRKIFLLNGKKSTIGKVISQYKENLYNILNELFMMREENRLTRREDFAPWMAQLNRYTMDMKNIVKLDSMPQTHNKKQKRITNDDDESMEQINKELAGIDALLKVTESSEQNAYDDDDDGKAEEEEEEEEPQQVSSAGKTLRMFSESTFNSDSHHDDANISDDDRVPISPVSSAGKEIKLPEPMSTNMTEIPTRPAGKTINLPQTEEEDYISYQSSISEEEEEEEYDDDLDDLIM